MSPGERGLAELQLEKAVEGVRSAEILSNRLIVAHDEVRAFGPGLRYDVRAGHLLEATNLRLPSGTVNRAPADFLGLNLFDLARHARSDCVMSSLLLATQPRIRGSGGYRLMDDDVYAFYFAGTPGVTTVVSPVVTPVVSFIVSPVNLNQLD